jgi:oligoribonuclease NrnB/cAMP/cGMP phosphodiesterase (DHH superfamily)
MSFDYSNTDIVIYHGGCPDGIGAAWCFRNIFKDKCKYIYGKHGEDPLVNSPVIVDGSKTHTPTLVDKHIVFVDFSYNLETMNQLLLINKSIRVLDHHKTALELEKILDSKFSMILDMERSGVQIAWDEMHQYNDTIRPWFVNDVADRDLWKWLIPGSKFTCRAMQELGFYESIGTFDKIQYVPREYFLERGTQMQKEQDCKVALCAESAKLYTTKTIGYDSNNVPVVYNFDVLPGKLDTSYFPYKVKIVECDYTLASEVGNLLVSDSSCDFSIMYRIKNENEKIEYACSVRADPKSNIDLTVILKLLDPKSGGHAKAAGMMVSNLDEYFNLL